MKLLHLDPAPWLAGFGVLTPWGRGVGGLAHGGPVRPPSSAEPLSVLQDPPAGLEAHLRRMDRYGVLGLSAAREAVAQAEVPLPVELDPDWGVSVGSSLGCWDSTARYYVDLRTKPLAELSPALFARTVSNAVSADISIALRLGGTSETLVSGWTAGSDAVASAGAAVSERSARRMVAGGVEVPGNVFRGLHDVARHAAGSEWLPEVLLESAALALLDLVPRDGGMRLRAFGRGHDASGAWSLRAALDTLAVFPVHSIIIANSVPHALLARWQVEAGRLPVLYLPERTGELGAAAAIGALALARAWDMDGVLVVSRGVWGNLTVLFAAR